MFQKVLAGVVIALLLGRLFFRARLRELGQHVDRTVRVASTVILLGYVAQLVLLALTRN